MIARFYAYLINSLEHLSLQASDIIEQASMSHTPNHPQFEILSARFPAYLINLLMSLAVKVKQTPDSNSSSHLIKIHPYEALQACKIKMKFSSPERFAVQAS